VTIYAGLNIVFRSSSTSGSGELVVRIATHSSRISEVAYVQVHSSRANKGLLVQHGELYILTRFRTQGALRLSKHPRRKKTRSFLMRVRGGWLFAAVHKLSWPHQQ